MDSVAAEAPLNAVGMGMSTGLKSGPIMQEEAVMAVPSHTANVTAREVLETDAIPASPSAGAVLTAAHQLMAEHPDLKRVVCVFAGQVLYE